MPGAPFPGGVEGGLVLVGDHGHGRGDGAGVGGASAEGEVLGGVGEGLLGDGLGPGVSAQVLGEFALERGDAGGVRFVGGEDAAGVEDDDVGDAAAPALQLLGGLEGQVAAEGVAQEQAGAFGLGRLDQVGVPGGLVVAGEVVEADDGVVGEVGGQAPVDEAVATGRAGSRRGRGAVPG